MEKTYTKCSRSTHRIEEEKKRIQKRLKTIEGQVRGIAGMIEDDRYCGDVLIQISAIDKSLKSLGNEILKSHLKTCVTKDIQENKLESIDEVMDLIRRLD